MTLIYLVFETNDLSAFSAQLKWIVNNSNMAAARVFISVSKTYVQIHYATQHEAKMQYL
jgi:hypothetical protein